MKKAFLTIMLLVVVALSASAKSVVFVLNDSTKMYYPLAEAVIKFSNKGFKVGSDTYEFASFDRFFISNEDAPFISNEDAPSGIYQAIDGEWQKQPSAIYDMNGRKVADGVELSSLPKGIYILKYGNKSVKFIKK